MATVRLLPDLYMGPCPTRWELPVEHGFFAHFVDLRDGSVKEDYDPQGGTVIRVPVPEREAPSASEANEIVRHINACTGPVYVHCDRGHGRALTVAALVVGTRLQLDGDEAIAVLVRQFEDQRLPYESCRRPVLSALDEPTWVQKEAIRSFLAFNSSDEEGAGRD